MRTVFLMAAVAALLCGVATAAPIDGKWTGELKMEFQGESRTLNIVLDLKSSGSALAGSVTTQSPRGERTSEIRDGKIDGNKFTFATTGRGRDGEVKITWEGTVEGSEMKGTQSREGSERSLPFTAKKQ
jgi:hypothetical protein